MQDLKLDLETMRQEIIESDANYICELSGNDLFEAVLTLLRHRVGNMTPEEVEAMHGHMFSA